MCVVLHNKPLLTLLIHTRYLVQYCPHKSKHEVISKTKTIVLSKAAPRTRKLQQQCYQVPGTGIPGTMNSSTTWYQVRTWYTAIPPAPPRPLPAKCSCVFCALLTENMIRYLELCLVYIYSQVEIQHTRRSF